MNHNAESLYDQKIQSISEELSQQGYRVVLEPSASDLPFNLLGYRPDLIATKGNEGIIAEVKLHRKNVSIDRLQTLSEDIAAHEGWKFLLVTLDDSQEQILPSPDSNLPSLEELQESLRKSTQLINDNFLEPSLLYFWGILEAALRQRAINQHLPVERFPASQLLKHMYSSGEISISEFDLFTHCQELRNKAAHGISVSIQSKSLAQAHEYLDSLLTQWRNDSHSP